jgi:DNA polymerase IV
MTMNRADDSVRTILHADLDAFYASVEQRDNPALRGKPVLVGMGVITAASYEAKRAGVRCPTSVREAKRMCPDAIVVPARMHAYSEASDAVFRIFRDTSPEVEGLSIDEAFIDVTGLRRLVGDGPSIARTLRARVAAEVGLPLSVGVATTKHLAKVASAAAKPDGLIVVEPGTEAAFLHPLPVEVLWGVGPVRQTPCSGLAPSGRPRSARRTWTCRRRRASSWPSSVRARKQSRPSSR